MYQDDERTPLLPIPGLHDDDEDTRPSRQVDQRQQPTATVSDLDLHTQFCHLTGVRPATLAADAKHKPHPDTLYHRAMQHHSSQTKIYWFTATLTNTLLLSQIVLGAALTALGASNSPGALIAVFGAFNTIIAGVVAFLKSRGQPMRARMFRDDLERVVDEIENSATMWRGISSNVHGYDAIDIDEQVTVRSEVARLTRLYDKAVKSNTLNDPDLYNGGGFGDMHSAALRGSRGGGGGGGGVANLPIQTSVMPPALAAPVVPAEGSQSAPVPAPPAVASDPDESPATKAPEKKDEQEDQQKDVAAESSAAPKEETKKPDDKPAASPPPESKPAEDKGKQAAGGADPDESPATSANPPKNNDAKK